MYDKLIERLREFADVINRANAQQNANENIVTEAADAIEELQKRVPKTPHGRLIDADALYKIVKKRARNWAGGWSDIECVLTGGDIKNAPTIIPAEDSRLSATIKCGGAVTCTVASEEVYRGK